MEAHAPVVEPKRGSRIASHVRRSLALSLLAFALASGCELGTSPPSTTEVTTLPLPDPLPSWNDGESKSAILDFVRRVTTEGGPELVRPEARIATFDNDGTLWSEQPIYVQVAFVVDRVKALAPQHPEWRSTQPFKGVLEGDMEAVAKTGHRGMMELLSATSAGVTTDAFDETVADWIASARDGRFDKPYTELIYQPMLELLAYLRVNGFKTFIVSGGGADFIRPWAERAYGIPPEQVVGSRLEVRYEVRDGAPVLVRVPEIDLLDDHAGKPVGIHQAIGRRPIAAFGNSDGDFEMLEWTTSAPGPRLGMIVHHTDGEREWAYDRSSHVGKLSRALDEAPKRGWVLVDMKREWKVIFPFEKR